MDQEIKCPNCESKPSYVSSNLSSHNHFFKLEIFQGTDDYIGTDKTIIDSKMNIVRTNESENRPGRTREGEIEIRIFFNCESCRCLWANDLSFHKGVYLQDRKVIEKHPAPWKL